ncbi:TetR/AcrR family transcriptional regulator [Catenulispora yoronensis]|uniref:TetR/AcrR family transcriptional regulator n=1 Tax=Catenulispora yoronensis TaxID=450799 RepID=A0ABN2V7I8_9ACTN
MTDQADVDRALDAAERLFNARGVQGVGMDAIRDASGVPLKRLYREFPSKADLLHAVLEKRDLDVRSAITGFVDANAASGSPRDRVLAVFDYLAGWFAEPDFRGCMFLNTAGELGGTSQDVLTVGRRHKLALRDYLSELVDAAELPEALADQLLVLANGAMATAALNGTPEAAGQARAAAAVLIDAAVR